MKVSINWLREFVEFDESAEQVGDILTRLNFECESIEPVRRYVAGVKVGRILESRPHPNADKLLLAKVDVGGDVLPIVCGAPNCREGLIVPVATPGTRLGGFTVEERKLRGELSRGMILSEREIGISDDHSGVLELDESFAVGRAFDSVLPADDTVLEFEVTVNRPDVLSQLGMARELAAYWNRPLRRPSFDVEELPDRRAEDEMSVEIAAAEQGPRYVARKVTGVTVGPSPLWMKARLHSIGQRPISNVVDITNYLLFELGHPLHAFDAEHVRDGRIIVRMAEEGERFVTLDDRERSLLASDLMIADPEKGIALAGVMGGANSEVSELTNDVIIEAAYFDPPTVRATAKRLALSSEASRRFERGSDPAMPPYAAARCAEMYRRFTGARVLAGHVDAYPNPIDPPLIRYRPGRAKLVLGFDVPAGTAAGVFRALEMDVEEDRDSLAVTAPSFRPDLEREVDLIEEVARHVGYEQVPVAEESRVVLSAADPEIERVIDTALDTMVALGFGEVVNSAMTSAEDHDAFAGGLAPPRIHKPINPEMNVYRASLIPGLLRVLEHNVNRGLEDVFLCEVGQVGGRGWFGIEEEQRVHLGFVAVGSLRPPAYDREPEMLDLPDLKRIVIDIARGLTLDIPERFSYDVPDNLLLGISVTSNDADSRAIAGLLKEEVAERFGLDRPVYVGEADLERWVRPHAGDLRRPGIIGGYQPFSRFPASVRDAAFVVPFAVAAEQVREIISEHADELLEHITLFDLYQGRPLGEHERSLAFRFVFRAEDRTLTDDEIDPRLRAIVDAVQSLPGVRLRGD
ncbi:MAG: Phenylalanine--tRNA ligase beta subunit [Calditrichaeota bacterium]|nr:Phenylalanine--tRNA ligase beta subunit [Calditrichota bacterium]